MSDTAASSPQRLSTVNLVRSSHPWTEADSAAGFVLRYLVPMRRQLTDMLGTSADADEALKILIGHLVSAGFGEHKQGKLRDFLLRAVRSAAKAVVAERPESDRPALNLDSATLESKSWLGYWREGLLERAWRALEREEHSRPDEPVYSVLNAATRNTGATAAMLVAQLNADGENRISESEVSRLLTRARTFFAQFIADEVAETLQKPTRDEVKREIATLGLGKAFSGIAI